jgi:hypothetical protein
MSTASSIFLRERFAHVPDLVDHVIDLGVVRGPVHTVETRRVRGLVDVDFGHREVVVDDLADVLPGLRVLAGVGAAVAVHANPVAELSAHQLVNRHIQGLAGEIPQGNFHRGQGRYVLAGLGTAEDSARPDSLPDALDVQRALADQGIPETRKNGWTAADRIDPFAVSVQALIGVDADMKAHEVGGLHVRDLQLGPLIRRAVILHGRQKTLDAERSGYARSGAEKGPSIPRAY